MERRLDTFTVCEPGDFVLLSVTNETGCPRTINTATQTVGSTLNPMLMVLESASCEDFSGTVDFTITEEMPNYTVTYPGGSSMITMAGTSTIMGVASSGTFTLVDDNGCETQEIFNFTNADCPLPVELISFKGKGTGEGVLLAWQTASEQNSSHFEIEHSFDGKFFKPIGKVQAAGIILTSKSYNFLDESPKVGVNYYRLRIVDLDDSFEYSEVVTILVSDQEKEILLYPSPTSDILQIVAKEEIIALEIWDVQGLILRKIIIDN